ncbi:hypothetical protein [Gloeocapsopsis sp. IPPAS B-1203]|uniref:hypothetical protein n=1 Tax=Gloeocapsopsis sp. IPPAS B-1203 TaxID=2049454 RepID=UPI000C19FAE1|nr:hypothetical protein [Gloeocapsopsis sp. IPPAS B-1203]PIG94590.1 hypothetical protein CSQ79_04750 [Gloeocapsopsis sp. IPPAS B-1203]
MFSSDLQDRLNWDIVLRKTYEAKSDRAEAPRTYDPIPPITTTVDSYTLAIGASSSTAKQTWYLAARVAPQLLLTPSTTSNFVALVQSEDPKRIALNRLNLIRFTDFGIKPYVVEIRIPKWFTQMYIEVWKYSGTDVSNTDLASQLQDVRSRIIRIENKLEVLDTWGN